jgi:hypothetical protein
MNNQAITKVTYSSLKLTSDNHSKLSYYSPLTLHSTNSANNYLPDSKSIGITNKAEGKEQNEDQFNIKNSSNCCGKVVEGSLGVENCISDGTSPKEITAEKVPSEINEDWSAVEYSSPKKSTLYSTWPTLKLTEETKELNTYTEMSKVTRNLFENDWNDVVLNTEKLQQSKLSIK